MIPWIAVQEAPLDAMALRSVMEDPHAGALVLFEGRARDHHEGRAVLELAYEAYAPMAEKELGPLREKAIERYGLTEPTPVSCVNVPSTPRFGTVGPGLP